MTDTADEFDFDNTPSAPATLTDDQPRGAPIGTAQGGGGDDYSALRGISTASATGPKVETRCHGSIAAPRVVPQGERTAVVVDFTVFKPAEFAGYGETAWFTVVGGNPTERKRDTEKLKKLCKSAGVATGGDLESWLSGLAKIANAREDIPFGLKPKSKGGHFVNP